ncbi:putative reductase [Calycina marina]|uniref:Reductase n=1 Tax=Calycina marina TaxID=1763456 RepID=A0A9P8CIU3_9HELO|nr:putative reductase [Calycina marina]
MEQKTAVAVDYANSSYAADEVVAEIKKNGSDAIAILVIVSVAKAIIHLFAQAVAHFGELHIVCSNSEVVTFGHVKNITEEEEYEGVMSISTRSQFFVAHEACKTTGQAKGLPKLTVYSGSKGAIETFVRCMPIDFGDKNITVNYVAPGGIKAGIYNKVCSEYIHGGDKLTNEEVDEYAKTRSPLYPVGLLIAVARVVCFLASQDDEWIQWKNPWYRSDSLISKSSQ